MNKTVMSASLEVDKEDSGDRDFDSKKEQSAGEKTGVIKSRASSGRGKPVTT